MVALGQVHATASHRLHFRSRLDTWRDDLALQALRHGRYGPGHFLLQQVPVDAVDQRRVDLDIGRPQLVDQFQGGITGAGVVQGQAESQRAQLGEIPTGDAAGLV